MKFLSLPLILFALPGLGAAQLPKPISDADLVAWVDARVTERTPPAEERRFDEIGWAKDVRDALRLAREHKRPVFLFTHDGRMNLGRC